MCNSFTYLPKDNSFEKFEEIQKKKNLEQASATTSTNVFSLLVQLQTILISVVITGQERFLLGLWIYNKATIICIITTRYRL
jgi:hypothetical protein